MNYIGDAVGFSSTAAVDAFKIVLHRIAVHLAFILIQFFEDWEYIKGAWLIIGPIDKWHTGRIDWRWYRGRISTLVNRGANLMPLSQSWELVVPRYCMRTFGAIYLSALPKNLLHFSRACWICILLQSLDTYRTYRNTLYASFILPWRQGWGHLFVSYLILWPWLVPTLSRARFCFGNGVFVNRASAYYFKVV